MSKFARYFLLVLSIVGSLLALSRLYADFYPRINSLGESDGGCEIRGDATSVPSGTGMIATAHIVGCDGPYDAIAYTTYVYVHKVGENDSAKSLVFSFDADSGDLKMVWTDNSNLRISISEAGDMTKKITSMDGVKISYSIAKEGYSPEDIARSSRLEEAASFVWLIFCIGVCIQYLRANEASVSIAAVLGISLIWLFFFGFPLWEFLV